MLEVKKVYKTYPKAGKGFRKERLSVLADVSFQIHAGDWAALVGESGSGKSTLSRLILGLEKADSGNLLLEGENPAAWRKEKRGQMSVVFQDYTSSANPAFQIKDIIMEPLKAFSRNHPIQETAESLMEKVGLSKELAKRYPHELSGGQLQRVCIARAISTKPKFLVLDEAVSSLDVSVQAQILDLLDTLKKEMDMTCLFIAHDLQTVAYLCNQVMFLNEGKIVEQIETKNLANVQSAYAKRLLEAVVRFRVE
ncbi:MULTISPECIES: ABC transporter ATP-binding protein [Oceanobacillus]|uniref:ABC transporter ATP-binding protein n=1 Tax=Oceanobacillus aidingensis TaxID=645964 RepID=A0ABV9K136_9BACI|nr:dipeptide/oligopeptide/nickel ABC transporter ATP-binding protein [Oceanobacillus oncorhynchi]MDM8101841.1 dipeptide/oligopeptide/nickel ABC transporter ATP-binding protein [Oceanobacillus oncorhynchi]